MSPGLMHGTHTHTHSPATRHTALGKIPLGLAAKNAYRCRHPVLHEKIVLLDRL